MPLLIGHLLRWINDPALTKGLRDIFQLRLSPQAIEKLEKRYLTMIEQRELIDELEKHLPEKFKLKLRQSLSKNPSYR